MASPTFQVDDGYSRSDVGPKKRSPWVGCLVGCLVVVLIVVVLVVIAGIWMAKNVKSLAAMGISEAVKQDIDSSDLPREEKAQIKVEIDRVPAAVNDGKLSTEKAMELLQIAMESPLIGIVMVSAAEQEYIDKSGLSDDEKADARVALRRFLRGSIDRDISQPDVDAALQRVANKQPNNRWRLRPSVSDEDLRTFLTEAKKAADEANVPEQAAPFDPSDEVKRIIDEAMSEPAEEPAEELNTQEPATSP